MCSLTLPRFLPELRAFFLVAVELFQHTPTTEQRIEKGFKWACKVFVLNVTPQHKVCTGPITTMHFDGGLFLEIPVLWFR